MNIELFVTVSVLLLFIRSILRFFLGLFGAERSNYYDWLDCLAGIAGVIFALWVWLG